MSAISCAAAVVSSRLSAKRSTVFSSSNRALASARPRLARRTPVAARASGDVWTTMSGYLKGQCVEAAALEAKDAAAGTAAWLEIEKQAFGARAAYLEHADDATKAVVAVDPMDQMCADDPGAIECKVFDE
eukprot:CAMPEP_0197575592 /NCGR_PEP_ID=MMETSP1326-20131121/942_1 /TAXON_ID=1155430 /ORGANISM="Genus nov. species nov., Strain RCC2288" /LENGTH=130 /DNA_ID=CAMNT_0043138393 /DNA_START=28 /DNA_END=420 /DNA_ORIENTATION=-